MLPPAPQQQQPNSSRSVVNSAAREALSLASFAEAACSSDTCHQGDTRMHKMRLKISTQVHARRNLNG
jgi:hypothetical protein